MVIAILAVLAFFEVEFPLEFAGPGEASQEDGRIRIDLFEGRRQPTEGEAKVADPAIEAAYDECFAAKDEEIHTRAFGTIDNPDVQKEFITSNRARAAAECRALHPEKMITIETPARFRVVTLRPRFW